MNSWTTANDIKDRLYREWDRGRILAAQLSGDSFFPCRIPLNHPSGSELSNSFDLGREWVKKLIRQSNDHTGIGFELQWLEINHRQLGKNKIPVAAIFQRQADALSFIGKTKEAEQFHQLCKKILAAFPELLPWLISKPLQVLAHEKQWSNFLKILSFLQATPRPAIYIRQLDVAGLDTKFIKKHKKLLGELLDIVLPAEAVDQNVTGVGGFEQRYGFLAKPVQIRFRLLDSSLSIQGLLDLQIPVDQFARLELPVKRVFITENMINGLAFPAMEHSMVIFGLGYGLDRLAGIHWLTDKEIYYWGDIDTHGFAMLDQLRSYFPQVLSLLMDHNTLMQHKEQWGHETTPTDRELSRLNPTERTLYNNIKKNHFAEGLRLEQEKIHYTLIQSTLRVL